VGMRWFLWRHWVGTQKIFPYLWIDWIGKASLLRDIKNATFFIMLIYFDLSIGATPIFTGLFVQPFVGGSSHFGAPWLIVCQFAKWDDPSSSSDTGDPGDPQTLGEVCWSSRWKKNE
jgi:hypothetical protein